MSPLNSKILKLLDLSGFIQALRNDPDLAGLDPATIPKVIQALFVSTGCDYISFFHGLGKATFLRYFFQYSSFITGINSEGSLANVELQSNTYQKGFLSFLRLVGTVYFKKHSTGFETQSPFGHFLKFSNSQAIMQHKAWIDDIRQNIADWATFDTSMIPSTEALFYHWKRTCWILHMWGQAGHKEMVLEPISNFGWSVTSDILKVLWDTEENIQRVQERGSSLLKGCKCATGCTTRVCGCRKKATKCNAGCQCTNCKNQGETIMEVNGDEVAMLALEEEQDSLEVDDEFAQFVFTAQN